MDRACLLGSLRARGLGANPHSNFRFSPHGGQRGTVSVATKSLWPLEHCPTGSLSLGGPQEPCMLGKKLERPAGQVGVEAGAQHLAPLATAG